MQKDKYHGKHGHFKRQSVFALRKKKTQTPRFSRVSQGVFPSALLFSLLLSNGIQAPHIVESTKWGQWIQSDSRIKQEKPFSTRTCGGGGTTRAQTLCDRLEEKMLWMHQEEILPSIRLSQCSHKRCSLTSSSVNFHSSLAVYNQYTKSLSSKYSFRL